MADHPVSTYEAKARARKALALVDVFTGLESSAEAVAALPEAGWEMAAKLARVNVPSQQTRDLVVDLLLHRAEVHATDPFVGLPA